MLRLSASIQVGKRLSIRCHSVATSEEAVLSFASPLLRVRVDGHGPPAALLISAPEPSPLSSWQKWSPLVSALRQHRTGAVWIVEWLGLGATSQTTDDDHAVQAAVQKITEAIRTPEVSRGSLHVSALAEVIGSASGKGDLRLVVGYGVAGVLSLRALRTLRAVFSSRRSENDANLANLLNDISAVVVAPLAWACPLTVRLGFSYPTKLRRRRHLGWMLQRSLDVAGLGSITLRLTAPSCSGVNPTLAMAWWLGLIDPVDNFYDVLREFLLASRQFDETVCADLYGVVSKAAESAIAANDDVDDDDFVVGQASQQASRFGSGKSAEKKHVQLYADTKKSIFKEKALPLLLLQPNSAPECQRKWAKHLELGLQQAIDLLRIQACMRLEHATVDGARLEAAQMRTTVEIALVQHLLELNRNLSTIPSKVEMVDDIPELVSEIVRSTLPVRYEAIEGTLSCLENPKNIAEQIASICDWRPHDTKMQP